MDVAFADEDAAIDVKQLQVKTWSLKRSATYGSDHYDEKQLDVRGATLSPDAKTLTLEVANLRPTWCMEVKYSLQAAMGQPVQGTIHNTIHTLPD